MYRQCGQCIFTSDRIARERIKYVLSKITEDVKRLLNISDIPIEDITWNLEGS
jgi:hypothetical protein